MVYGNAGQEGLEKLQRLQNKCLKICKRCDRRADTEALHSVTKVPKLKSRRIAHVNNFMYSRLSKFELVDKRDIRTRAHAAPLFKVKTPNLTTFMRSVGYAGATQWNSLPQGARNLGHLASFKARQKKELIESIPGQ